MMNAFTAFALFLCSAGTAAASGVDDLRLNQLQILGTHNSYRIKPPAAVWKLIQSLPASAAGDPKDLDYAHDPLPEQLEAGIRSLELDLYNDPQGGQFARRSGMVLAGESAEAPEPDLTELKQPGFKILHLPDFDFASSCLSLRTALTAIRDWSHAHPAHVPLIIHLETKDETIAQKIRLPGLTKAVPWDAAACDALDAEIRLAFGQDLSGVFTPDKLRGSHATLEKAALAHAWPALRSVRGHVLFVMEGVCPETYVAGHPSLQGRVCFVYGNPGTAETAFLLMNNAERQQQEIARRVKQGYLVRTRADSGTTEARSGNTARRTAAFGSGAHIISTDYPQPDERGGKEKGWTSYQVSLPDGAPAVANPVTSGDQTLKVTEGAAR